MRGPRNGITGQCAWRCNGVAAGVLALVACAATGVATTTAAATAGPVVSWSPAISLGATAVGSGLKHPPLFASAPADGGGVVAFQTTTSTATVVPFSSTGVQATTGGFGAAQTVALGPVAPFTGPDLEVPRSLMGHDVLAGVAAAGRSTAIAVAGRRGAAWTQLSPAPGDAFGPPELLDGASPDGLPTIPAPLIGTAAGQAVAVDQPRGRALRLVTVGSGAGRFARSRSLGDVSCKVDSVTEPLVTDARGDVFTAAITPRSCVPSARLTVLARTPQAALRPIAGGRVACGQLCSYALGAGGDGRVAVLESHAGAAGSTTLRLQTGTQTHLRAPRAFAQVRGDALGLDAPAISRSGAVTVAWSFCNNSCSVEAARAGPAGPPGRPVRLFSTGLPYGGAVASVAPGVVVLSQSVVGDAYGREIRVFVAAGGGSRFRAPQRLGTGGYGVELRHDAAGDDLLTWSQADGSLWAAVRPADATAFDAPHELAGRGTGHDVATAVEPGGLALIAWADTEGRVSATTVQLGD